MQTEWIAVLATLTVATASSGVVLFASILSKENKLSELRQAWIDSLRQDLALCVSVGIRRANLGSSRQIGLLDQRRWEELTDADKARSHKQVDAAFDADMEFFEVVARIRLRLNPIEPQNARLLMTLQDMEQAFNLKAFDGPRSLGVLVRELESAGQLMLKSEWERVNRGEPLYRIASGAA